MRPKRKAEAPSCRALYMGDRFYPKTYVETLKDLKSKRRYNQIYILGRIFRQQCGEWSERDSSSRQ